MPFYITQVALERDGLLPEDDIVNTWHWAGAAADSIGQRDSVLDRLTTFYNSVITLLMSGSLTGNYSLKIYDFEDPTPRVPLEVREIASGNAPTAQGYPCEVALCLSMAAPPVAGVPQARRRGRVYLGPLKSTTGITTGGLSDVRPDASVVSQLLVLAQALNEGDSTIPHVAVYSPTTQLTLDPGQFAFNLITSFSVDNSFDTQRRRGAAPTSRTSAVTGIL